MVDSITETELYATTAGGASAFAPGELGAGEEDMRSFWRRQPGISPEVGGLLAQLASSGGVWGDPPTLVARCAEIEALFPAVSLNLMLRRYPRVLSLRPQQLRAKLHALSDVLPRVDVIQMVTKMPQ